MTTARAAIPGGGDAGAEPECRHTSVRELRRSDTDRPSGPSLAVAPSESSGRSGADKSRPQWEVVEQFAHQGFLYQVRRKLIEPASSRRQLTPREEEVLARVMEGESNKSIAYALGLSPSTVGVLLFRAAGKLGAKSRDELVSQYVARRRIR